MSEPVPATPQVKPPTPAPAAVAAKPAAPAAGALPEGQYSRRDFLNLIGWAWLSAALGGFALAAVRYMFPNILYEPNPVFKAGFPKDYPLLPNQGPIGAEYTVDLRWQKSHRVWIVTTADGPMLGDKGNPGIWAFWAKCTHLGCTPRWVPTDKRFECPCHGSQYSVDGANIAGPAPLPLFRCAVTLSQDGQIVVNKSIVADTPSAVETDQYFIKKSRYA